MQGKRTRKWIVWMCVCGVFLSALGGETAGFGGRMTVAAGQKEEGTAPTAGFQAASGNRASTVEQQEAGTNGASTVEPQEAGTNGDSSAKQTEILLQINEEYVTIGAPLTVTLTGAPADMACTYEWSVDGTVKATGETYTPQSGDLEKMLTVTATASGEYSGTYQTSMYVSKLPVLYLDTEGKQAITSKEVYINGGLKIQGNTAYHSDNTTLYDGDIQIKGRGNSTWRNPKKPYKIKLDTKTDIFGFGKSKHWVLLANYTDESHMRNMLSYELSGAMGMPYMQSVPVDLILNGEYQGTYQFCEQVRIADGRVNIQNWEDYAGDVAKAVRKKEAALTKDDQDAIETLLAETDMSWLTTKRFVYNGVEYKITDYIDMPDFTGGFLIELDSNYDEVSKFKTGKGQPLQFSNPEFISTNHTAMQYVKDYINTFEKAIDSPDFTAVYNTETLHYSELFDMDSLVQYWLVSELFMNVDAMKKSTYLYKDIDGPAYMGPIWDMDWSSDSIVSRKDSGKYDIWQTVYFHDRLQANQWYKSIIQDPYFAVRAYEWYTKMRDEMENMVTDGGKIDIAKELLLESADANAKKWYGSSTEKDFTKQAEVLRTYLVNRLSWLDARFTSPETLAKSLGVPGAGGISIRTEDILRKKAGGVSVTAKVTDSSTKSVEFIVNGKRAGIAPVTDGKATISVPAEMMAAEGAYQVVQVYGVETSGSVVVSGGNKVTDYVKFILEELEESKDTEESEASEQPSETQEPEETEKPQETQKPEASEQSSETQKPEETEKPQDTQKPEETEKPESSETTNPTEKPESSETTNPTENAGNQNSQTPTNSETSGSSQTPGNHLTEGQKKQVDKLTKQLGVSEETAIKIQEVGEQYDVPEETLLISDKTVINTKSESDIKGSSFALLQARAAKITQNQIQLKWTKVKGADGYLIYGNKCGKSNRYKLITTIKKSGTTSFTQKKLKKGTFYKYIVRAYKEVDGQKVTLAVSKTIHIVTAGGKNVNEKSVSVNKTKWNLQKGKNVTIKASAVKGPKKPHRKIAYESTNPKVARVSAQGKITAVAKGKCKIYVYSQSGLFKKIEVTVY